MGLPIITTHFYGPFGRNFSHPIRSNIVCIFDAHLSSLDDPRVVVPASQDHVQGMDDTWNPPTDRQDNVQQQIATTSLCQADGEGGKDKCQDDLDDEQAIGVSGGPALCACCGGGGGGQGLDLGGGHWGANDLGDLFIGSRHSA